MNLTANPIKELSFFTPRIVYSLFIMSKSKNSRFLALKPHIMSVNLSNSYTHTINISMYNSVIIQLIVKDR